MTLDIRSTLKDVPIRALIYGADGVGRAHSLPELHVPFSSLRKTVSTTSTRVPSTLRRPGPEFSRRLTR